MVDPDLTKILAEVLDGRLKRDQSVDSIAMMLDHRLESHYTYRCLNRLHTVLMGENFAEPWDPDR